MLTLSLLASALGVLGSAPWAFLLAHLIRHRHRAVFLADLPDSPPGGGWPTLALAFAARDEAATVGEAARSMLALAYPDLELIAVDDRSTDATGATLDALAREDGRLRVIHVRDLPPGWLGKTNALQVASETTEARWILFTDADVTFEPTALGRAVAFAEANRVDHVAVVPEVLAESVGERAFLALFGLLFAMNAPLGRLEDRRSRAHAGVGAFNLVRLETFRAIGGFRHLALSVDDDMRLGQALKFAGYPMRLVFGRGLVSVRWQVGVGGLIRGLEKNFFAATNYRPAAAFGACAAMVVAGMMPYLGLFVGPWWARLACGLGVGSIAAMLGASSRNTRIGWYYAVTIPLASALMVVALVRSVALTLARGGVLWRNHLYPLGELRAHVRAREAWAREVWRSTR